jgi:broad specificity phosphatase PhoE
MFEPDYAAERETWEAFHARVDRAWALVQDTAAHSEGHLAVVTHGLVCRSLAARHLVLPPGEEAPTAWGNTALTIIDHPAPWRVRLLNCIAHLDDLEGQPIQDSGRFEAGAALDMPRRAAQSLSLRVAQTAFSRG